MKQSFSRSILISMFILGLTACGYQEGGNGNKTSISETGDNRQEYIIKNRTAENDYLNMNTDPHMDTRVSDEKIGTKSNATLRLAESDMEQNIRQRVLQMDGVQTADVHVKDKRITIRFQAKNGASVQELKQKIADVSTKLYGLQVNVTTY